MARRAISVPWERIGRDRVSSSLRDKRQQDGTEAPRQNARQNHGDQASGTQYLGMGLGFFFLPAQGTK